MPSAQRSAERRGPVVTPVLFRFRPARPVQAVELRGDMIHWLDLRDLARAEDGWLETSLLLEPDTYLYKFRVADGEWLCDPHNPRTRSVDGVRNSLLVVGGAEEPVLHAPSPAYVFVEADGRLCVRAGLRRHAGHALTLRWDEGHGVEATRMQLCGEEDDFLLFQAHLPVSATTVSYLFVLPAGRVVGRPGGGGQAFRLARRAAVRATPSWWRDAVLYTAFVDRFRVGGAGGTWPADAVERLSLDEEAAAGGNLRGVREALPHLVDLGVTVLHLTPVFVARSAHRYDVVAPRRVDPSLGGEPALAALLDEAHGRGLRVLLDPTVTHVHRDFPPFQDVARRGPASPFWEWFVVRRHPFGEGEEPGYEHYQKGRWQEPLLQLDHPEVAEYVVGTFERWARLGVDGFRIDAAADIPIALCERIGRAVRAIAPDAALFAEVTVDNSRRWTARAVDGATDFSLQEILYDWLWRRRIGAAAVTRRLARRRFERGGPAWCALAFTATHDQARLGTLVADGRVARLAHLLTLLGPEIPVIYYGDEIGLRSDEQRRDFEGAWPDRMCMSWDEASWDRDTLELFRRALELRRTCPALAAGDTEPLALLAPDDVGEDVLCVRRTCGQETVDLLVNGGPAEQSLALPDAQFDGAEVLLAVGAAELDGRRANLGPWSALVLRRVRAELAAAAWRDVLGHSRALSGLAFARGEVEAVALPTHLYLTVTEACNARCRHCINRSGERTAAGRAREIQPWVLDRLGDALAAADYFGFAHGGESLVSPMLFETLGAIARRRLPGRSRYDVHLLSNGMALTADTTRRLVDLGVTSLAVSLDGATALTNDSIRVGTSFERVVAHLQAAIALREQMGADLRVGLSTVVLASNVGELGLLAELAVDLGVDWLKIEELCSVNDFGRSQALPASSPHLIDQLGVVRETLAAAGVVCVEHLVDRVGCDCQAVDDPKLRAFRAADDFANRAHFHPCRAAWEQACIDPDGSVHPVDYHHPSLGRLLDVPLFELWDGPVARRLRAAVLQTFPQALRESCPSCRGVSVA